MLKQKKIKRLSKHKYQNNEENLLSAQYEERQAYIIKVAKLSPNSQVASKFKRTPKNDNFH